MKETKYVLASNHSIMKTKKIVLMTDDTLSAEYGAVIMEFLLNRQGFTMQPAKASYPKDLAGEKATYPKDNTNEIQT